MKKTEVRPYVETIITFAPLRDHVIDLLSTQIIILIHRIFETSFM